MNYSEEQNNELEALEAIYSNELNLISRKPFAKFSVSVKSEESVEENSENDSINNYEIELLFTFVDKYPDCPPLIEVQDSINLDENDEQELLELLEKEANNSTGMVMIFTLVSVAIEWINKIGDYKRRLIKENNERIKREAEELEMKKFEGTRVTVDSFMTWKFKFEAEMSKLNGDKSIKLDTSKRLTGRELFEKDKSLIVSDLQFPDETIDDNFDDVKVDESLFQDIDDLELEDDSDR